MAQENATRPTNLRFQGILETLLSGVFFGTLGLFGKKAYEGGMAPGELLGLRFICAGSLLLILFLLISPRRLRISKSQFGSCVLLGVFGYAIFSSCFFQALQGLSASLTVLMLYMYPVLVSAGAWLFFGESIPKQRWVVIPVAMVGLALLVWGEFSVQKMESLLFGVGAALFYSAYILASSRLLKDLDSLVAVTYIQSAAGLVLGLIHFRSFERVVNLVSTNWMIILLIAVIPTVGAMALFLSGLKKLKSWEVSILSTAEPVTGVILATLLLRETLSWMQIIGGLLVLTTLVFVSLPSKPISQT